MMIKRLLLLVLLLQLSAVAHARMYQWTDPDTGTTQLSGKPPPWYRNADGGPRVFVFENGRLVDDTAISLSEQERERLRQLALLKAEQDRQVAMQKLQQANQQKAILDLQGQGRDDVERTAAASEPARREAVEAEAPRQEPEGPTAEELRALIEQYERQRTENARQLVETVEPEDTGR